MVDTFSHGIWSFIIFAGVISFPQLWLAIFFGMMPDLFSWTIYMFYVLFTRKKFGKPNLKQIPKWVFKLYGITHSVFVVAFVFLVVYLFLDRIPLYLLAWPIHILIDIPTHSRKFLPTPFLWPFSKWHFPGISWANPWIMGINWGLIFLFLLKMLFKF